MSDETEIKTSFFHKKWVRGGALVIFIFSFVSAAMCVDLWFRAKQAYLEGEKYYSWHLTPSLKQAYYQEKFNQEKATLDKQLKLGKISHDTYDNKLQEITIDNEFFMSESSIKYAYQWYKDAYELFTPPTSKWAQLAKEKAPIALELWKKELAEKHIPFKDYMLD